MDKETEEQIQFRLEITGKVYIQTVVTLREIVKELQLSDDPESLSKVAAIKLINNFIKEEVKRDDKGFTALLMIDDLVGGDKIPAGGETERPISIPRPPSGVFRFKRTFIKNRQHLLTIIFQHIWHHNLDVS